MKQCWNIDIIGGNMAEAFRQGLYIYVGGFLFCIAVAVLLILNSRILDMSDRISSQQDVVYDLNVKYFNHGE